MADQAEPPVVRLVVRFRPTVAFSWVALYGLTAFIAIDQAMSRLNHAAAMIGVPIALFIMGVAVARIARGAICILGDTVVVRNPIRTYSIGARDILRIGSRQTGLPFTLATPWGQMTLESSQLGPIRVSASTGIGLEGLEPVIAAIVDCSGAQVTADPSQLNLPRRERRSSLK